MQIVAKVPTGKVPGIKAPVKFVGSVLLSCPRLAKDLLVLPDRLHRGCVAGVVIIGLLLISCFITYAYVEKYQLTDSFFYGQVEFSFIDRGYPEIFGYILELVAAALFLLFAVAHHKKAWFAWSAMMFIIFLDDAFKLHESIGHAYVALWNLHPVSGDLLGFATTGLFAVICWTIGVTTITTKEDFSAYLLFSCYFGLLIFFGVGVDALHGLFGENVSQTVFTLAEDGGELLMTAMIALSALGMWLRQKDAVINTGRMPLNSAVSKF
ncbi:hypothetical protein ACSV5M_18495 [Cellvibrio sp. ARAG 10.3]|uniref:hypothetical protein n=1 Tax=Cellvibrio sp. ARAG 10.3 TaxID=3451358 RepID=UPI003F44B50B